MSGLFSDEIFFCPLNSAVIFTLPFRFNLCRAAVKSSYVNLDSRTNEEVKVVSKLVCKVGFGFGLYYFRNH